MVCTNVQEDENQTQELEKKKKNSTRSVSTDFGSLFDLCGPFYQFLVPQDLLPASSGILSSQHSPCLQLS